MVMVPLDYMLAVALLTQPAEVAEKPGELDHLLTIRATAQALAIDWEILDTREVRFILTRAEDFEGDLHLLRRRYQDLADAPPLHDCFRFPDRSLVNDLLSFNRSYRQYLDTRQMLEPTRAWTFYCALQEVDRLYQIWDLVRDARCEFYYITVRRQALKKLRDSVGPASYYSGTLPPHVPVWHFARID
jgi:hypothetical protein